MNCCDVHKPSKNCCNIITNNIRPLVLIIITFDTIELYSVSVFLSQSSFCIKMICSVQSKYIYIYIFYILLFGTLFHMHCTHTLCCTSQVTIRLTLYSFCSMHSNFALVRKKSLFIRSVAFLADMKKLLHLENCLPC